MRAEAVVMAIRRPCSRRRFHVRWLLRYSRDSRMAWHRDSTSRPRCGRAPARAAAARLRAFAKSASGPEYRYASSDRGGQLEASWRSRLRARPAGRDRRQSRPGRCRPGRPAAAALPGRACRGLPVDCIRRAGRQRQRAGRLHRRSLRIDAGGRRRPLWPGRAFRASPVPPRKRASLVARKFQAARNAGLVPILCVGESLHQREAGQTEYMHRAPVAAACSSCAATWPSKARSSPTSRSGRSAPAGPRRPEQAQAVHAFIRGEVAARDAKIAGSLPILYGGSCKPGNAAALFSQPDVDGGLIGGASLVAADFLAIAAAAASQEATADHRRRLPKRECRNAVVDPQCRLRAARDRDDRADPDAARRGRAGGFRFRRRRFGHRVRFARRVQLPVQEHQVAGDRCFS